MKIKSLILVLFLFGCNHVVFAHGVSHTLSRDTSVIIKAEYSDGTAMSYAEVEIYAPGDETIEYQNGRTDKNGIFAFVPNEPGIWIIHVDDGMGHGFTEKTKIERGNLSGKQGRNRSNVNQLIGAMGVILSLVGFLFYWKSTKG